MRIFVVCCNYNALRLGTLPASLAALQEAKLNSPETVIGVIDNASKDGSMELLKQYCDKGGIDVLVGSEKNLGKAMALNVLFKELLRRYNVTGNDLVMSMDSDIQLLRPDFFRHLAVLGQTFRGEYSAMSVTLCGDNRHLVNFDRDCRRYYVGEDVVYAWPHSDGVAGGVLVATADTWAGICGYRENTGRNRGSAVYGTDDCVFFRDAFAFNHRKPILISRLLCCYHPDTSDPEYRKWKDRANCLAAVKFGNPDMPAAGFFDAPEK